MFIVRDIFKAKPGKAKDLVAKFKAAAPHFQSSGLKNVRVMTDIVADYWTVVLETECEDLAQYFENKDNKAKAGEAMKGYMDFVEGGHREIFRIE
jgi:hypothetical protein